MTGKCNCCGTVVDLRMGYCYACIEAESIIADGTDMYDKKVAKKPMVKLKHILAHQNN